MDVIIWVVLSGISFVRNPHRVDPAVDMWIERLRDEHVLGGAYAALPSLRGLARFDDRLSKLGFWLLLSGVLGMTLAFGLGGTVQPRALGPSTVSSLST